MSKRKDGEERRLRPVKPGEKSPEPFEPTEAQQQFLNQIWQAVGTYDQIVAVCGRGGFIVNFIALEDQRHHVRGMLNEALDAYDEFTCPMCNTEDD